MTEDLRRLAREIAEETGGELPSLLADDAPVLDATVLEEERAGMYLVGLIGGKDVGKSALVNALVGYEITERTSYGPGTEIAIAYAHRSQAEAVRSLLEREAPGRHRVVQHENDALARQVLVDLPDIDSHWSGHVELTRRMLKHMLYPIWVQSVEKYADQRPQQLLELVAAGNAPENFIFCLNKVDQVHAREGEAAARELAEDYARRLAALLKLPERPRVWMVSALHPERYDLPALRRMLAEQKSESLVAEARRQAVARQGFSLARWIETQGLEQRLRTTERLLKAVEEEVAARLVAPLLERTVPQLERDPAYRMAMADELMAQRVQRWPIVNIVHAVLGPALSVLRRRLPLAQQQGLQGAEALAEAHVGTAGAATAAKVAATFAFLRQSWPQVGGLYARRRLWEPMNAEQAEADLRQRLAGAIEAQRETAGQLMKGGVFSAVGRLLLTVGALLWFPLVQPVLSARVDGVADMVRLAVSLLGVEMLLKHVTFLGMYYVFLWAALKWRTQRRVDKLVERWGRSGQMDARLSLEAQVVAWGSDLLAPARAGRDRLAELVQRVEEHTQLRGKSA